MQLDVLEQRIAASRLREDDELIDSCGKCTDLRNRRRESGMLLVDRLRDEDQAPHQKKSVSPSVNRHARRSVWSSPARAFPMKCSVVRVGKKPALAYVPRCSGAGTAISARTPSGTACRLGRRSGRGSPTRSAMYATAVPRCSL